MTISQSPPSLKVELVPARGEQAPILANLIELYAYDFSEFMDIKLGADGRFGYKALPLYWQEPTRYPFLILVDGHLAGFVFVRRGSEISDDTDVWDMAEFFVMRGYRRLGIGMKIAQEVWDKFPGKWEVRVMNQNKKALGFWQRSVSEFLGQKTEPSTFNKNGKSWYVFSFESKCSE
jgi:predicted acetyltransferase